MKLTGQQRIATLVGLYGVVLWGAGAMAFLLRFDLRIPAEYKPYLGYWVGVVLAKLAVLRLFDQYAGLLTYFSIPDFKRIVYGMTLSGVALLLARFILPLEVFAPPRGVILMDYVLSVGGLTLLRLGFRILREGAGKEVAGKVRRVAILGAGDVGARLVLELGSRPALGMKAIAFFDDNPQKVGGYVHGVPVMGAPERLRDEKPRLELEEAIIAMPSATTRRIAELVNLCQQVGLRVGTVPSLGQLASGRVRVSQIREVEIEDLLGRDVVQLDGENLRNLITGRVVLVSGAGGSIGSELCRQIAGLNPQRLLLLDRSEVQLFPVEQELIGAGHGPMIVPVVADILDEARVRGVLSRYQPSVIFHAAAHKHVPMMESQPGEAFRNNSLGTACFAKLALEANVDRFVLISTDKAINPTSVMGASKRLAEIFLQSLSASAPGRTRFIAVRFGNVLGSSGSVVPIFKRQIAMGGPVTVTHPEVTRYFMTIPEAVALVMQSAALGTGGEIFVLDMGKPVRIVDLARQLIELSGLRPDVDIEIRFTGLRPGEKMFEEISHHRENHTPTTHPKIMRFVAPEVPLDVCHRILGKGEQLAATGDPAAMKALFQEAVPEYRPYRS